MRYVRQRIGLDEYDVSRDDEINRISAGMVFTHVCNWNGFIGWSDNIKCWIEDIYGIELDYGMLNDNKTGV